MKLLLIVFSSLFFMGASFVGSDKPTFETKDYGQKFQTGLSVPLEFANCKSNCDFKASSQMYEGDLPKSFDWRKKGISPIRSQGSCGSCWAFSLSSVLEDNLYLRGVSTDNLSEQFLVGHDYKSSGCRGGWINFHMFKGNDTYPGGTMLEEDCPYRGASRKCGEYSKSKLKWKIKDWNRVDSSGGVADTEKIKRAMYSYGPISVAVSATGSFGSYRSGIYNGNDWGSINHAVDLVGWNDEANPPHWIMRNSWGTGWGEDGYMRIAYGAKKIGYAASYIDYDGTFIDSDGDDDKRQVSLRDWAIIAGILFVLTAFFVIVGIVKK